MKIVIKLDDELYNEILSRKYSKTRIEKAVANGTPLPEHHGRLKDVDWIDENCNHHFSDIDGSWCYTWRDIDKAPTIIEGE